MGSELLSVYSSILNGFTTFKLGQSTFYVKHLGPPDLAVIEEKRSSFLQRAKKEELPTNEEALRNAVEIETWTEKEEQQIRDQLSFVEGLRMTRPKIHLKSQLDQIKKEIEGAEKKIEELNALKNGAMGITVEKYCDKKLSEFSVWYALRSNVELTSFFYSQVDFDELTDDDLRCVVEGHNQAMGEFTTRNIQRTALSAFFTNFFYLCNDDPYVFYGKPIVKLTNFQAELFGFGRYFKHILSELQGKVPSDLLDDPERLMDYVNTSKNINEIIERAGGDSDNVAVGIVGKKGDIDHAGENIDLARIAREKGGKLSMKEMMDLHGV